MRVRSLAGIQRPTPVDVEGTLASPAHVRSPVTGAMGVVIQYWVFVPARFEQWAKRGTFDRLVESSLWGESLVVATADGELYVPLENVTVYFAGANNEPHPLIAPLPRAVAHLAERSETHQLLADGMLFYRELCLDPGQKVRVRGTVGPASGEGAYRISAAVPFVLRGDLEPATVSVAVPEFA